MPCLSGYWDTFLEEGTPEYDLAKSRLLDLMDRVKHVIDYYFAVNHIEIPEFDYSMYSVIEDTPLVELTDILDQICFHLACDGMSIPQLYDLRDNRTFENDKHFSIVHFLAIYFRHNAPKLFPNSNYRTLNSV